ncbi:hypothetical protein FEM48_ZijujUnG0073000 [Ziziphus jujuba var. spinosa]|uniref:Uncharacterized protein n=1 Tax=Ziziphus jujuba var. spinosa TaxID=714518 RepID=A0A978U8V0_ZIZJJ|nr:hypothetical protein FEM48_ZijujUnG0073000 [Ziziphus jujuba var. spinosa]
MLANLAVIQILSRLKFVTAVFWTLCLTTNYISLPFLTSQTLLCQSWRQHSFIHSLACQLQALTFRFPSLLPFVELFWRLSWSRSSMNHISPHLHRTSGQGDGTSWSATSSVSLSKEPSLKLSASVTGRKWAFTSGDHVKIYGVGDHA